jgi:hypothetical protein
MAIDISSERARRRRRGPDLEQCAGYRVESTGGRVGVVHEVRRERDGDLLVAVRAGAIGRRLIVFPGSAVTAVVPAEARVELAFGAAPVDTLPAA